MDNPFFQIGNRQVWGGETPFGFSARELNQHLLTIGKSGTGKSTLLQNIIQQHVNAGLGVIVVDPHGDLATELLDHFPPWRADDLIVFRPSDIQYPIAFNPLANVPPDARHLIATNLVDAFKSIWRDSTGPRMNYILSNAVAALLDCHCPNITLLSLQRMLSDAPYRAWIVRNLHNPVLRAFWVNEFECYDDRFRKEAVAPIQNKLGAILTFPLVNILGQVRSTIDFRDVMDRRRVFIADLSKGALGDDKSNLIGALLIAQVQSATMSRSDIPEAERVPFTLVVDEFQNVVSTGFASLLSESRKYKLSVVLGHQYIEQVKPEIRDAVFGNVGSIVAFRVGESDGNVLSREFGEAFIPSQFSDLSNFQVLVKTLAGGQSIAPFRGVTTRSEAKRFGRREKLLARTRDKYATPRAKVEERIVRWMGQGGPRRKR